MRWLSNLVKSGLAKTMCEEPDWTDGWIEDKQPEYEVSDAPRARLEDKE